MARSRGEEIWAAQMIEAAVVAPVTHHDDGSAPGLFDLRIDYPNRQAAAVEVTACVDSDSLELWKLINPPSERWIDDALDGGWMVSVLPTARANRLRRELPPLLRQMESAGSAHFRSRLWTEDELDQPLRSLGITALHQGQTDFPGSIYVTIEQPLERMGGWVADHGEALSRWAGVFLREPQQRDVLTKLGRSGLSERHAFVIVTGFPAADFDVTELLMRNDAPLPEAPPELPAEVTHFWVVSTWASGTGMRWSPDAQWQRFSKLQPEDDD